MAPGLCRCQCHPFSAPPQSGIDNITELPADRVDVTSYFNPDKTVPDKIYCTRGGFIPNFDFDPREFNFNMLQMEDTDTNQARHTAHAQGPDWHTRDGRDVARERARARICGRISAPMNALVSRMYMARSSAYYTRDTNVKAAHANK